MRPLLAQRHLCGNGGAPCQTISIACASQSPIDPLARPRGKAKHQFFLPSWQQRRGFLSCLEVRLAGKVLLRHPAADLAGARDALLCVIAKIVCREAAKAMTGK